MMAVNKFCSKVVEHNWLVISVCLCQLYEYADGPCRLAFMDIGVEVGLKLQESVLLSNTGLWSCTVHVLNS